MYLFAKKSAFAPVSLPDQKLFTSESSVTMMSYMRNAGRFLISLTFQRSTDTEIEVTDQWLQNRRKYSFV